MACPNCNYLNPAGANFCNRCGTRLSPPAENERRLVTVLFVDIADFSSLAEQLDLEQITQLTSDVFDELRHEVVTLNGTIDKYIGDAMLALFGTPKSHEDDPARALRCALAMLERIERFNQEHAAELLAPIALHIGIETGVVVAEPPELSRQGYSVTGEAVRLAAQLQKLSAHNEILVGESTYNLTTPLFDWTALGTVAIRSKQTEVPVYRLLRARDASESGRGLQGLHTPLIGRAAELAVIVGALEQLAEGKGGAIGVLGEVGFGKSRLVREAFAQAQQLSTPKRTGVLSLFDNSVILAVEGRCLNYGVRPDYQPWQDALRHLLAISDRDSETAISQLRSGLLPLGFAEDSPTYTAIGRVLGLISEPGANEPAARTAEAAAACAAVFTAVSRQHPLVITLEDLHWADVSSLDLLRQLLPKMHGLPILFIMISRPVGDAAELISQLLSQNGQTINLQPLSDEEVNVLVCNLLAIKGLPDNISRLLRRAEGNPFFVEEIVRTLFERSIIVPDGDGWRIGDATTTQVPNTLQGIIGARIDMLPAGPRRTLRVASVLGRRFNLAELAALDRPSTQHANLEALVERGLLFPVGNGEYSFHHVLTQEVAYSTLLLERRRRYHTAAAEYCATTPIPDPPHAVADLTPLLSAEYHYAMAGDYQAAYELINRTVDSDSNIILYRRLFLWGELSTAIEVLNRLAEPSALTSLDVVAQAEVLSNLGLAYAYLGDATGAMKYCDMATSIIGDNEYIGFSAVYNRLGAIYAILGNLYIAVTYYEKALNTAEHESNGLTIARSLNNLGLAYLKLGRIRLAQDYSKRALEYNELSGNLDNQGILLNNLGVLSSALGQLVEAQDYHKKALFIAEQLGTQLGQIEALNDLGAVTHDLGDVAQAIMYHQRAYQIAEDGGYIKDRVSSLSLLAEDYTSLGKFDVALDYHERALNALEDLEDASERGEVVLSMGNTYLKIGNLDLAIYYHKRALEYFSSSGDIIHQVSTFNSLATDYNVLRRPSEALGYAKDAVELAEKMEAPLLIASAYHQLGTAKMISGEYDTAYNAFKKAVELRTLYKDPRLSESLASLNQMVIQQNTSQPKS